MTHFKLVRTSDIYESAMHEDNGVSIGGLSVYLLSKTATKALMDARPAGKKFTATIGRNEKWLDKFIKHTGETPEQITFAPGKSGRWYAQAMHL